MRRPGQGPGVYIVMSDDEHGMLSAMSGRGHRGPAALATEVGGRSALLHAGPMSTAWVCLVLRGREHAQVSS